MGRYVKLGMQDSRVRQVAQRIVSIDAREVVGAEDRVRLREKLVAMQQRAEACDSRIVALEQLVYALRVRVEAIEQPLT